MVGWGVPQSGEQGLGRPTKGAKEGLSCPRAEDGRGRLGMGNSMRKGTAGVSTVHCQRPLWVPQYVDMGPLTCQEQLEPKNIWRDHEPRPES